MANPQDTLAEFQGLYGPFTVTERVLQKIWLQGDFATDQMRLTDGRPLELISPGEWNLLGGPDFHGAQLRIEGREVRCDVEVHFYASDWWAHKHPANPNYQAVALHVLLFPPERSESPVLLGNGEEMPTLVLLPLLHRDLEEYAADDALEGITARDEWRRFAELGRKPIDEIRQLLREEAAERWRQKVHFARLRINKLGWIEAAHQTALEILGYRRNRAVMLKLAARYPRDTWIAGIEVDEVFEQGRAYWQLLGVRPANHPRTRLRQHHAWVQAVPDWPEKLVSESVKWPAIGVKDAGPPGENRRDLAFANMRNEISRVITGNAVSGTRFDTMACDGLFPLAAAQTDRDLSALWFDWFLGDVPLAVRQALRRLGVAAGHQYPLCHGFGQGLLGWILKHQADAST